MNKLNFYKYIFITYHRVFGKKLQLKKEKKKILEHYSNNKNNNKTGNHINGNSKQKLCK